MADADVERRNVPRFFCHRCNVEFNQVLQNYSCPFCNGGFVEQLEGSTEAQDQSGDDFTDADMSNIGDMSGMEDIEVGSDQSRPGVTPIFNDMASFMAAAGLRTPVPGPEFVQELIMLLENGRPRTGVVTAGAPLVFVGAPGDYVLGGEGLDAVITQMLGQLDTSGPPPLPGDQLAALPTETITAEQAAENTTCSICWENFLEGESVSRLECLHMYHSTCIRPWLQLHATCPICRRSLLVQPPPGESNPQPTVTTRRHLYTPTSLPRVILRRLTRRPQSTGPQTQTWDSLADSSSTSGSTSTTSSVTTGGVWAPQRSTSNSTGSNSTTSLNSSNDRGERQYNMDIDYD
ncbi:PREDICTED: E3 ubiquitin-protein ligase RNF126-like [Papilio xuthus]|uniref:RING-type E3 ubiquitin transferase n=1 Tax=Papilio xuthus TaxID=66420 RepID=A0AAJ6ZD88_PAPXU|nr:PREDICTED: E3 ubiquitin-protein ligase RNF126-like [Papilio xuthus]